MLLGHNNHWLVVLGHVGAQQEAFHELLADGARLGDLVESHEQDESDEQTSSGYPDELLVDHGDFTRVFLAFAC